MRVVVCASTTGNVRSVLRAIEHAAPKARVELSRDPDAVRGCDVLVVPGQGSFGAFAASLEGGLGDAIVERIRAGTPYLGICLGLQVLFGESAEAPGARGLGVLEGHVGRLAPGVDPSTGRPRELPHIGWNEAVGVRPAFPSVEHYYFAHTYAVRPADERIAAAYTEYGERFVSAVEHESILGVQFHPEKSQRAGLALLERFFDAHVKRS